MPLVLDATVGGATANAYCTVATADAYFLGRPFSAAWVAGDPAGVSSQALVFATSLLEREEWKGTKGSTPAGALTQALAWPRRWAPSREYTQKPEMPYVQDFIDLSTAYESSLTIPPRIVKACQELALEILTAVAGGTDPFARAGQPERNLKRQNIGGALDMEWVDVWYRARGLALFPSVMAEIVGLLRAGAAVEIERC